MFNKIRKFITNPKEFYPNINIFLYHLLKAFQKVLIKLGLSKNDYLKKDTFNWSLYHIHYKGELKGMEKIYSLSLKTNDYELIGEKLIKKNNTIKPLHSSHRFLYETIMLSKPQSVFEMGCGAGINLHNLNILLPNTKISGIDISEQQLKNLKKTYPHLNNLVKQADATIPFQKNFIPPVDIAFTQAVLMHIHTNDLHLVALTNLFKIAQKQVILMESERKHHYIDQITKLHAEKKIGWKNIYFYNRLDWETKQPLSIICSKEKLDTNFFQIISLSPESNATYLARSANNATLDFYDKLQKIK